MKTKVSTVLTPTMTMPNTSKKILILSPNSIITKKYPPSIPLSPKNSVTITAISQPQNPKTPRIIKKTFLPKTPPHKLSPWPSGSCPAPTTTPVLAILSRTLGTQLCATPRTKPTNSQNSWACKTADKPLKTESNKSTTKRLTPILHFYNPTITKQTHMRITIISVLMTAIST
jgi:hypothetical protein